MMVLGIIAAALAVSQLIGGLNSANTQANMQGNYYNFLADQSNLKANFAKQAGEENAEIAQDEGAKLNGQLHESVKQIEAAQKVGMISQGIELGSVTAEDVAIDTLSKAKLDEMAIRYNADLKSYQARKQGLLQAWDAYNEGATSALSGQMMSSATRLQGRSSLIGGAAQTSANAYAMFGRGGTTAIPSAGNSGYSAGDSR